MTVGAPFIERRAAEEELRTMCAPTGGRGGGEAATLCPLRRPVAKRLTFLCAVPGHERAAACQGNQVPGARHALPLSQGVEGDDGVHNDEDNHDKGA